MRYGVNNVGKVECKLHEEWHAADERCRWCEPETFKSMAEDMQPEEYVAHGAWMYHFDVNLYAHGAATIMEWSDGWWNKPVRRAAVCWWYTNILGDLFKMETPTSPTPPTNKALLTVADSTFSAKIPVP